MLKPDPSLFKPEDSQFVDIHDKYKGVAVGLWVFGGWGMAISTIFSLIVKSYLPVFTIVVIYLLLSGFWAIRYGYYYFLEKRSTPSIIEGRWAKFWGLFNLFVALLLFGVVFLRLTA